MVSSSPDATASAALPHEPRVPHEDLQRMILAAAGSAHDPHRLGYAVVDTGATETVGSLEALEFVMNQRMQHFGAEDIGVDVSKHKRFKFGNAEERAAESFVHLPQTVNGIRTTLGVYTLDVPGVPVLLGIKTMNKLGAIVNVRKQTLEFTEIFPGTIIPLTKGQNGHLLLDLCRDWNPESRDSSQTNENQNMSHTYHLEQGIDQGKESTVHSGGATSAADPQSLGPLNVHVVENGSDTNSEVSADQALQQYVMHGLAAQAVVSQHPHSPPTRHAEFHEDHGERDLRDGGDRVCQGTCDRSCRSQVQGDPESGTLRLEQSGVGQPQGQPCHQGTMLGSSHSSQLCSRSTVRSERSRHVGDMQQVHVTVGLHPDSWSQWSPQEPGTAPDRHPQGDGEPQGGRFRPSPVTHQESGLGRSRRVSHEEARAHPPAEEQNRQGGKDISASQPGLQECERSIKEGSQGIPYSEASDSSQRYQQEIQPRDPRSSGSVPSSHSGQLGRGGVRPLGDRPFSIEDDALLSHELEDGVQSLERDLLASEKALIAQSLERAAHEIEEAFVELGKSTCDLMEVCCGPNSSLTQTILEKGGVSFRVGFSNKMDMSTTHGTSRAREFAELVRPRWMWITTPCGSYNPNQNTNQNNPQQVQSLITKQKKSRKIIRNCVRMAKDQILRGGHLGWEWPRNNLAWNLPEVVSFFQELKNAGLLETIKLDGCCVGTKAPFSETPLLKPWKIQTTSLHLGKVLSLRCPGNHQHDECSGHDKVFHSGQYPQKMCSMVAGIIMEHSREVLDVGLEPTNTVFGESVNGIFGVHEATNSHDMEKPWDEKEFKRVTEAVRKLHINFGHPTNRALMNCLKARGVDPKIVKLAGEIRCDECQEVHLPTPHSKTTLHGTHILWHTMQMDIAQLPYGDQMVHVLLMVDEASHFMIGHELFRTPLTESRNCTAQEAVRAIEGSWTQYHGLPNCIRCDPEGSFRSNLLREWAETRGVELQPCAAEDHGQIGLIEAMVKKVKDDARTLLRGQDLDPFVAILQVISAHNHLDRIGGYAPSQWAYGRLPTLDNRLFEGGNSIPFHATEAELGTDLRANLQLRVRAEGKVRQRKRSREP